ncbi:hypothetical protein F4803DRAFT_514610 [Xylaria telfairii]|nr:hypothetical protein F4803DRAFT_514610 [Xylaria telfairii]
MKVPIPSTQVSLVFLGLLVHLLRKFYPVNEEKFHKAISMHLRRWQSYHFCSPRKPDTRPRPQNIRKFLGT